MKPIAGYENAQVYIEAKKLPALPQITGVLDAEVIEYDWGSVLVLDFDISDGEYKNFYSEQYRASQLEDKKYKGKFRMNIPKGDGSEKDEWTMRRFKTNMTAIEESNPGFRWDWDEKKLKGKKTGMIYQEREWEFNGKTGFSALPYCLKSIKDIEDGNYKIPDPKYLQGNAPAVNQGFAEIPDTGDLPF